MKLETEAGSEREDVDERELRAELLKLSAEQNSFAILSTADEIYLQTAAFDDGFQIEKRDGSADTQFYATRPGVPTSPAKSKSRWKIPVPVYNRYSLDETIRIFVAYLAEAPEPFPIIWMTTEFGPSTDEREAALRGLNIFFWIAVAIIVGILLLWFLMDA